MKLKEFLAALACAVMIFATVSCDDDPDVIPTPLPDYSVITFENAELDTAGILREQTLIGADEYEMGNFWQAYTEQGIVFKSYVSTMWAFWCGMEISGNHDMDTADYSNESSVYNPAGKSGSKFVLCYDGGSMMGPGYESEFYTADNTNKVFDHVYITNSTWAALLMMNGDATAKKLNYTDKDWFKLKITGIDSTGIEKDSINFYLADFRTANSGGIVTEWTKVDLTSLGAVQRLQFTLSGTDNNSYGLRTPAYFCMDDLAIKN